MRRCGGDSSAPQSSQTFNCRFLLKMTFSEEHFGHRTSADIQTSCMMMESCGSHDSPSGPHAGEVPMPEAEAHAHPKTHSAHRHLSSNGRRVRHGAGRVYTAAISPGPAFSAVLTQ